jgi:hypothetical protein
MRRTSRIYLTAAVALFLSAGAAADPAPGGAAPGHFPAAELRTKDYLYRYEDDPRTGLRITVTDTRKNQLRFLQQVSVQPGCAGSSFSAGLSEFPVSLVINGRPRSLGLVVACGADGGHSQTVWILSGFEPIGHLGFDESMPNLSLVGNDAHAVIKAVVYTRRWNDDGKRGEFLEVYELSPLGSGTGSFQLSFDNVASSEYRRYYDSLRGAGRNASAPLEVIAAALIATQDFPFICAEIRRAPAFKDVPAERLHKAIDFNTRFGFPHFNDSSCRE